MQACTYVEVCVHATPVAAVGWPQGHNDKGNMDNGGAHICTTLATAAEEAAAEAGAVVTKTTPSPFPVSTFLFFVLNHIKPRCGGSVSCIYI